MTDGQSISVAPVRRRVRFRAWHALAGALVILGVVFVIWRVVAGADVQAAMQAVREAGYPATPAELDRWYAAPNGPNVAEHYLRAGERVRALSGAFDANALDAAQRIWFVGLDATDPNLGQPLDRDVLGWAERYVQANGEARAKLRQAAARLARPDAGAHYPVAPHAGAGKTIERIGRLRRSAKLLCLEALVAAERGEAGRAVAALVDGAALSASLNRVPNMMGFFTKQVIDGLLLGTCEDVIDRADLTVDQLQRLAASLRATRAADGLERALVGELATYSVWFGEPGAARGVDRGVVYHLYHFTGLADADQAEYLRTMLELIDAAKQGPPRSLRRARELESQARETSQFRILLELVLPGMTRTFEIGAQTEAQRRCALTALAATRYRQAHQGLPGGPSELVPDYMNAAFHDPFDGEPLRYMRRDDGSFAVYSLGVDVIDDGGKRYNAAGDEMGPGADIVFEVGAGD
jgi:hypothetical protein